MFETLDRTSRFDFVKRLLTLLASIVAHALAILVLLILPLVCFGALPESELLSFIIMAPVPPPPPAPPAPPANPEKTSPPAHINTAGFIEPTSIPAAIPPPSDEPQISGFAMELLNGQGEIPGGTVGPASEGLRNLLNFNRQVTPAPPPRPTRRDPLPVGGIVQEARLVTKVQPVYPDLAIRARVSGLVILQVSVDEEGNVYEIKVLKGHPLLDEAAVNAVRQWKYSPTLLNGEPVPVIATVTVIFNLR
jgi:protein TonB